MDLAQFVKKHKTQTKAAEALGLSQGMISGRLTGRYPFTADAAIDYERRSNGELTRYELLPEVFGAPPSKPQPAPQTPD
jgi:DNA-binding transcriptional regulator YdaS (Cro superfamily)